MEHILTALLLSVLLLVSGTGIKFQRLICLFPPCSPCLQDAIGLPGAAPVSEEETSLDCMGSAVYQASRSTCAPCLGAEHPGPGSAERASTSAGSHSSERGCNSQGRGIGLVWLPKASCSAADFALEFSELQTSDGTLARQEDCALFLFLHFILVSLGAPIPCWPFSDS